jgi:hypothetical protein
MFRHCKASRCRIDLLPAGSWIFHDRFGGRAVCRNPRIVKAFLNGTFAAARRKRGTGHWEDAAISGRSDMAVIGSLRDGRRTTVTVRFLELHDDLGLTKQPTIYPSLPDLRCFRDPRADGTACHCIMTHPHDRAMRSPPPAR